MTPRRITLAVLVVCGLVWIANGFGTRSGYGVDADTANSRIHQRFEIPGDAKDVNYTSTVWSSCADFSISEASFLKWVNHRGWKFEEAHEGDHAYIPVERPSEPKLISSGYVFDGMEGEVGFVGVYDNDLERASISYVTQ